MPKLAIDRSVSWMVNAIIIILIYRNQCLIFIKKYMCFWSECISLSTLSTDDLINTKETSVLYNKPSLILLPKRFQRI